MAELSDKELKILNKEIERGGLTYTKLQKEIFDHLCCDIEVKMDEGIDFIRALEELRLEIGQDSFKQIQEDTLLLINQKYRMMKKFMYILGMIAPTFVIVGTIFKIQHLPGAGVLLVLGLFLLAAIYLPVFISIKIRDTRNEGKPVNKGIYIIGMISGIIFILGAMFKIMHWPGASIMITLAGLVTVGVFIPLLVLNALRDKENQVQNFTVLIFVLSFIAITFMTFALSTSKSVLSAFNLAVNDNKIAAEVLQQNNLTVSERIVNFNPAMIEDVTKLADKVNGLNEYIDETIEILVKAASEKNTEAFDSNGNIDFQLVHKKESVNAPAAIMLGIDNEEARAEVLKQMMEDFNTFISGLDNKQLSLMAEKLLDTSPVKEEYEISWASNKFEHLPMISVLVQLTNIQVNLMILQSEVLSFYLADASDNSLKE